MTPTCFNCIYSFGAIEHRTWPSCQNTLICWPSGNQEREQLAYKLCDEYKDKKEIVYVWECNECGSQEYTMSVSETDVNELGCSSCGGDEWHKAIEK